MVAQLVVDGFAGGFMLFAEPGAAYKACLSEGTDFFINGGNLNDSYNAHMRMSDSLRIVVDGMQVRPNLYDVTRRFWHVNKANADQINYLLGVYKGVVRCVIKPTTKWLLSKRDENGKLMKTKRYYIEGLTDDKEGNDLYLNKLDL